MSHNHSELIPKIRTTFNALFPYTVLYYSTYSLFFKYYVRTLFGNAKIVLEHTARNTKAEVFAITHDRNLCIPPSTRILLLKRRKKRDSIIGMRQAAPRPQFARDRHDAMANRREDGDEDVQQVDEALVNDQDVRHNGVHEDDSDDEVEIVMVLAPLDPVDITGEECDWATDIKEAINLTPGLSSISDFMCAQLALFVKDDVEEALERAIQLQAFKEEYGIMDTLEDGRRFLRAFIRLFPRQVLDFSRRDDGTSVIVQNLAQLDSSVLTTKESMRSFLGGSYYLHHALYPDFASMRSGALILVECAGMSFPDKQDFRIISKMYSELSAAYPLFAHVKSFHTSSFYNIMASTVQRLLPRQRRPKFETGCTCDTGRLDTIFLVPTVEIANQRVLSQLSDSLRQRYEEDLVFSLNHLPGMDEIE